MSYDRRWRLLWKLREPRSLESEKRVRPLDPACKTAGRGFGYSQWKPRVPRSLESETRVRPLDRGSQLDEVMDTPSGSLASHDPMRGKRECGLSIVQDRGARLWILLVEASRATTPREGKERARKPLMEVSGTRFWILLVECHDPYRERKERARPLVGDNGKPRCMQTGGCGHTLVQTSCATIPKRG